MNALTVAGWFELAETITAAGRGPRHPRRRAAQPRAGASTPASTSRRCRTPRASTPSSAPTGGASPPSPRSTTARCPVIAAVQRLLRRRRHRPRRQRRHHRRQRRRLLRAARGRPGRARRGHPPGAAGARSTRCGRWSTPARPRPPPSCTRSARVLQVVPRDELRDAAFEVAADDRGEVADRDPRRQGVPQRHRPLGREALATGSSRASRSSSTCRASSDELRDAFVDKPRRRHLRVGRRTQQSEHVTDKRMTEDDVVARAARRHDDRHRRLGIAAQADEPRARARCAPTVQRPHDRRPTAGPTSACCAATGKVTQGRVRVRARSTRSRSSRTSATPARRARSQTLELDEGMFLLGPAGRGVAGAVPADPGRARLRRDATSTRDPHGARRRTTTARSWSPCPRSTSTSRSIHMNRGDAGRQRPVPRTSTRTSTTSLLHGRAARAS